MTRCTKCNAEVTEGSMDEVRRLRKELIEAGELHLADEQTIRNLEKKNVGLFEEIEKLQKVVGNIRRIHSPGTTPGCSVCDALSGLDEKEEEL